MHISTYVHTHVHAHMYTYAYNRSQEYEVNGDIYMRMRFYMQGDKSEGTVHLEIKRGTSSSGINIFGRGSGYEWRYLLVEIPGICIYM